MTTRKDVEESLEYMSCINKSASAMVFKIFDEEKRLIIKESLQEKLERMEQGDMNVGLWQPIDTAPKDGVPFLALDNYGIHECCLDKYDRVCYKVFSFIETKKYHTDFEKTPHTFYEWDLMCRFGFVPEPTHWMPLPQPPKS